MTGNRTRQSGPLVTVLISTYNRPQYLGPALGSILNQTYENIEVILVRDGGEPVRHVVDRFDDSRLHFIDRDRNRGLPASFNEALSQAKGEYVCYLGDDDLFYPEHVEVLVDAMESQDECRLVYSDLYKAHCRVEPDGRRTVLAKNVEISRDFDRYVMLHYNHTLHVSLMHDRKLFEKAGLYNEDLNVLIDWDLTRKMCFYTDFLHVHKITGEFYAPVGDCDRISVVRRKNTTDYLRNVLTIRSTRPPKPWPKVGDLSMIVVGRTLDQQVKNLLGDIWSHGFYPHQIYLPMTEPELKDLQTVVPNIVGVPVAPAATSEERIDAALKVCEGDWVAVIPADYQIDPEQSMWIERSLKPLIESSDPNESFYLLDRPSESCWATVFKTAQLRRARRFFGDLSVPESVQAAGIRLRGPAFEEYPFQFDAMLSVAEDYEAKGEWVEAARIFKYLQDHYANELWMQTRWANALYHSGRYRASIDILDNVFAQRPTVATYLLKGRSHKRLEEWNQAIACLERAETILDGRELSWTY